MSLEKMWRSLRARPPRYLLEYTANGSGSQRAIVSGLSISSSPGTAMCQRTRASE